MLASGVCGIETAFTVLTGTLGTRRLLVNDTSDFPRSASCAGDIATSEAGLGRRLGNLLIRIGFGHNYQIIGCSNTDAERRDP